MLEMNKGVEHAKASQSYRYPLNSSGFCLSLVYFSHMSIIFGYFQGRFNTEGSLAPVLKTLMQKSAIKSDLWTAKRSRPDEQTASLLLSEATVMPFQQLLDQTMV